MSGSKLGAYLAEMGTEFKKLLADTGLTLNPGEQK